MTGPPPGAAAAPAARPSGPDAAAWDRVRHARRRLLFLDYDGTLAPFHAERDRAVPFPGTLERLRTIVGGGATTVAIVSGRPLAELGPLLDDLPVLRIGEHGWEEQEPGGAVHRHPLDPAVAAALDEAHDAVVRRGHGDRIERKRAALVLHVRGLAPAAAEELKATCRELWRPWPARVGVRLDEPNGGLELRATGRDKGTAVGERIARAGAGTFAVYVGDDRTDEDAFRVVRGSGLGIRVGAPDVPTLAEARLPGPEAMPSFLDRWIAVTGDADRSREEEG